MELVISLHLKAKIFDNLHFLVDVQSPAASAFSPEQPTQSRSPFSASVTFSPSSITGGPTTSSLLLQHNVTQPAQFNVTSLTNNMSSGGPISSAPIVGGGTNLNPTLTDVQMVRLAAAADE